ncbi:MAG: hypothetical protein KatS3mg031_2091 [Chitinophagales bacterium]|nr:MAG: hypothetical protein KatS3mg031_2091 [Chitinophagales bacterium]
MTQHRFAEVGIIKKAHGIEGRLKVSLFFPLILSETSSLEVLFLGKDDKPIPYFLKSLEPTGKGDYILHFEDCHTRDEARRLVGMRIFVPLKQLDECFDTSVITEYNVLIGFMAFTTARQPIGIIEDIYELPHQYLARVIYFGKEVLLPLNTHTIVLIDKEEKTITLQLPEGMLDL